MILGFPGKAIAKFSGPQPRTAAEAKGFAKSANEAARKKREADDRAHQKRQAELEEQIRKNREAAGTLRSAHPSGSGRGRLPAGRHGGPRLDVSAVYRDRNTVAREDEPHKGSSPTPRRPRSFGEIAARHYGAPAGDGLIPSTGRGGVR
jgi:hypothetical protein